MSEENVNEPRVGYTKHYTYADYLRMGSDLVSEIINGKIWKMSPGPSTIHQRESRELSRPIMNYLVGKPCEVFTAPYDVVLPTQGRDFMESDKVVQPDILVVCDPTKIKEQGCFGAPDWIIEIISPHTTRRDLQDKYVLYENAGVGEYWVVEPRNNTIEVFILEANKYKRVQTYVSGDFIPPYTIEGLGIALENVFSEA